MCGRDSQFYTWSEVHAFSAGLELATPGTDPVPNYNRAPTQPGWVLVADGDGARALEMRWGLLPAWARDTRLAYSTINARCETAATKPAFRSAWKQRRGIVPSSGYYEWQKVGAAKQPHFIRAANAPVLVFVHGGGFVMGSNAGTWEQRGHLVTYSSVTRPADPPIAQLHDRMPLILPGELLGDWLHGSPEQASEIALSAPEPELAFHPVAREVGNVRNTGPQLIAPMR